MKFFLHIPVALILIVLAAVALTFYVVTQTTLVHRGINRLLAQYIEEKYDIKIDYGEIGGSLFEYLTVDNVRVDFEAKPHRYRLAKIKRLEAYYNINNLWHGIWALDSLIVYEPTVILRSDSTGKLLVPSFGGEKKPADGSKRDVRVDRLKLVDGRFQWFKVPKIYLIDSINVLGAASVTSDTVRLGIDSLSLTYPPKRFRVSDLRTGVTLSGGMVKVDSLNLSTDSSWLQGAGVFALDKPRHFTFSFAESHVSLAELSAVAGINLVGDVDFNVKVEGSGGEFSGNADLDGTFFGRRMGPFNTDYAYSDGVLSFSNLTGEAFDGTVEGSMELNLVARPETFTGVLRGNGINLEKILPNSFRSRLSGELVINGSGMGANSFNIDLDVDLGKGRFDFVNFDSLRGTISLNVNDMYFHPGFSLHYKNSRFTAEGVVDYNGEMFLNGEFATMQLADFWGDLFIEELSGGGSAAYVVSGQGIDPDIRGIFKGDSCSFYGFSTDSLTANFDIESFLYRRRGSVEGKAWRSNVWNLPAESVLVGVDIDSELVAINRATLYHPRYLIDAKGNAVVHDSTASVKVHELTFLFDSLRYVSAETIPVEFLADRIVVEHSRLKGNEGSVNISCEYRYDTTINLTAAAESFDFAPWLATLGYDTLLEGSLHLNGTMTGRLRDPAIKLAGGVEDLAYGTDTLGSLETNLSFSDSTVAFQDLTLHFKGGSISASGRFPLIMDLDSGIVAVPQAPLSLAVKSSGNDLSILASVNEDIESFAGEYEMQLDVYGTPQQPQSQGFFNLKNGTIKVYQMENPIEEVEAQLKSQDKRVTVDWSEGKVRYKGKEGIVRAVGDIFIKSKDVFDYDLSMVGFDVPIKYDLGDIYGRCDFDLAVKGSTPPTVIGDVTVKEAAYFDEFETEEVAAAIEAADTSTLWDYEIRMDMLPASVIVKNSDVNMVLDGYLSVVRKAAHDNYFGTLNVVRGNSYLFDLNFRIEEGSRIIFDDIEQPNPQLDIKVSTRVRNYAGDVGSSTYDRLDLVISGTLLQPTIRTAAGSTYSDEDIMSVILANKPVSTGENDPLAASSFQRRIQIGSAGYLAARTSQALSRKFGVEVFDIAPSYSERNTLQGATVSLGLYTLPNIYTYVSSLSLDGRADYGAEYRFGRHFYLGGVRDRDNQWRLNLNLNWEFK